VLDALAQFVVANQVARASVILGADASLPGRWQNRADWLDVISGPVELADLYPHHELLIARAGRNTAAEAAYCGMPTVLLPITADPHRGTEQTENVTAVAHRPNVFPLVGWNDPRELRQTLTRALAFTRRGIRPTGHRGNDAAASFVTGMLGDRHSRRSLTAS
jgi:hypothetical protein